MVRTRRTLREQVKVDLQKEQRRLREKGRQND